MSACKGAKVAAVASAPSIFPQVDQKSPQEVKDYGDFTQFVEGGRRFRSDFVEAYSRSWQQTPFGENSNKRPEIPGFEAIFALYDSYAVNARFGKPNEFRNFFTGPAATTVQAYESQISQLHDSIKRIYQGAAISASEVRFLGLVQEMIDAELRLKTVVQDRIYEITGAKETKVDQGVIEFFDHAGNLVYLRLSLEYLRKMIQSFDNHQRSDEIDPVRDHALAVLVQTYALVADKRNFRDCDQLLGHTQKNGATRASSLTDICTETGEILTIIQRAQKDLGPGKYHEILELLNSSVTVIQRLSQTIDSRLKELGLAVPATT
jgi:hypothetical protein